MNKVEAHKQHAKEDGGFVEDYYTTVIKDLDNKTLGDIELFVCRKCAYIRVNCEHTNNTWSEEGTTLSCNLCGMDVT